MSRTVSCRRPPGSDWFSLADGGALRTVRQCSVDTAYIAVDGLDSDLGFTSFKTDVAVLSGIMEEQTPDRAVMRSS